MKNNYLKYWSVPFITFFAFLLIAFMVCNVQGVTVFDIKIIHFLQNLLTCITPECAAKISLFHHNCSGIILLGVLFFLIYKKDFKLAMLYLVSDYTCRGVVTFFKEIIQRHRPPVEIQPLYHPDDFSFPSGHSYAVMLFLGLMIYIIFKYVENKVVKYILTLICTVIIILVGLSRLLLAVHYPTDVCAGFLLGFTVVAIVWIVDKK
ncbi:phosphatase PAP2 family protein [bacterium]|nr:phosphatase PAP2 family protein [bacterium]